MRAVTTQALQLLLLSGAVTALPEITIAKHRHADFNPARLRRRQNGDSGGTVETNIYDVLTWSTGGAYYANGESCVRKSERSGDAHVIVMLRSGTALEIRTTGG
jgi:hypothetical protein